MMLYNTFVLQTNTRSEQQVCDRGIDPWRGEDGGKDNDAEATRKQWRGDGRERRVRACKRGIDP